MATRKLISFDWAIKKILRSKANFDVLEGLVVVKSEWFIITVC